MLYFPYSSLKILTYLFKPVWNAGCMIIHKLQDHQKGEMSSMLKLDRKKKNTIVINNKHFQKVYMNYELNMNYEMILLDFDL